MKMALRLAKKALGRTSPNPMVGAVIVKDGKVIAEDYHKKAGQPHAEALAIETAGDYARGATLYVNLEPCCHTAKRTPPCTKAIISSGINSVVISMQDPNPKVSGQGIEELEKAGIEVTCGVLEYQARRLNEAYIKHITTGKPFATLKVAMTLDGKIAQPDGHSKWITSAKSRRMVHKMRSASDAVLTAIGTVKADDPEFTARIQDGKNPIRVVIDPNLETPVDAKILKTPPATIIVTKRRDANMPEGVEVLTYDATLSLGWLMTELGKMGIVSLLIEGGSSLTSHCIGEGIVDKVVFFIAPKIIGGGDSIPAVGGKLIRSIEEAIEIKEGKIKRIGGDFVVEGYVKY